MENFSISASKTALKIGIVLKKSTTMAASTEWLSCKQKQTEKTAMTKTTQTAIKKVLTTRPTGETNQQFIDLFVVI